MEALKIVTNVFAILGIVWTLEIIVFSIVFAWEMYKDSKADKRRACGCKLTKLKKRKKKK